MKCSQRNTLLSSLGELNLLLWKIQMASASACANQQQISCNTWPVISSLGVSVFESISKLPDCPVSLPNHHHGTSTACSIIRWFNQIQCDFWQKPGNAHRRVCRYKLIINITKVSVQILFVPYFNSLQTVIGIFIGKFG